MKPHWITLADATRDLEEQDQFPLFSVALDGVAQRWAFVTAPPYEEWRECLTYSAWVYGATTIEVLDTLADPQVEGHGLFRVVQGGLALGYGDRYRQDTDYHREEALRIDE